MAKRLIVLTLAALFVVAGLITTADAKKRRARKPSVTFVKAEVQNIQPFYLHGKKPGRRGAFMNMAFYFKVYNPYRRSILLDRMQFTSVFDGFPTNTMIYRQKIWTPPRKTNLIRIVGGYDAFTSLLNLLVTGGAKLGPMSKAATAKKMATPACKKAAAAKDAKALKKCKVSGAGVAVGLLKKWYAPYKFKTKIGITDASAIFKVGRRSIAVAVK